jgi:ribulose-5-phosphate 4-epimerase/fuculose-1-phosphate aldolase
MAVPALAAAGGAGTETFTEHGHEVPFFSFPAANPCTGEAGTISAVATNFVFHITEQADGEHWITGTGEGVATFTPEQLGGVSARGHFTAWFGEALNQKNSVEHDTNTIVLRATDGSHIVIHAKSHISTNAKGEPTVEFEREKMSARCG